MRIDEKDTESFTLQVDEYAEPSGHPVLAER
jgi:hypothetical protein